MIARVDIRLGAGGKTPGTFLGIMQMVRGDHKFSVFIGQLTEEEKYMAKVEMEGLC